MADECSLFRCVLWLGIALLHRYSLPGSLTSVLHTLELFSRCSQCALSTGPCRHYVMTWKQCGAGSCLCTNVVIGSIRNPMQSTPYWGLPYSLNCQTSGPLSVSSKFGFIALTNHLVEHICHCYCPDSYAVSLHFLPIGVGRYACSHYSHSLSSPGPTLLSHSPMQSNRGMISPSNAFTVH